MCIQIEGIDGMFLFLIMCGEVYIVHGDLEWDCCWVLGVGWSGVANYLGFLVTMNAYWT
jgi:hypothetical protein